jgi:hypothetical protein
MYKYHGSGEDCTRCGLFWSSGSCFGVSGGRSPPARGLRGASPQNEVGGLGGGSAPRTGIALNIERAIRFGPIVIMVSLDPNRDVPILRPGRGNYDR